MIDSAKYWNERYKNNRNSGAGSYGRLAEFKAEVINKFVADRDIQTVIEFGCGDGNQLTLANYPIYIGYDVSDHIVKQCKALFEYDHLKNFYHISEYSPSVTADLTLSLDVIFHLVEDKVFEDYMTKLFETSNRYVIIYSSNNKNMKSKAPHVRHRTFTDWIDSSTWKQIVFVTNKYPFDPIHPDTTSFADFYIYEKNLLTSHNSV